MASVKFSFFTEVLTESPAILVEYSGKRMLIDPGQPNHRSPGLQRLLNQELHTLDALILTHYHGDHVSLLQNMLPLKKFKGAIYCHPATREIISSYYSGIQAAASQFKDLKYRQEIELFPGVSLTLYDAGHVLGSSIIYLRFENKRIIVSGDLGADALPIVRPRCEHLPEHPVDLLLLDGKHVSHPREVKIPIGDVLYHKLQDCFLFDDGNVIIYAPMVQIPMLVYCLNYIFNCTKYRDLHQKVKKVYLDPQPKVLQLIDIFKSYEHLFDRDETERVVDDKNPFEFGRLEKRLPGMNHWTERSILITPNRAHFKKYFKKFKKDERHDVLLLNQNIYYALEKSNDLIDAECNIQIKRLPFLHYHPDLHELSDWFQKVTEKGPVKQIIFYHYKDKEAIEKEKKQIAPLFGDSFRFVHQLPRKQYELKI